jgi:histidine triad (HIT) family protein
MDCFFCRIASGEVPATIVARSGDTIAFRDLNPQAPVHLLVIPVRHVASAVELAPADRATMLGAVMALAVQAAAHLGLAHDGYRLVVNTGRDGGQTVDHLHVHLLGGRQMTWPPG